MNYSEHLLAEKIMQLPPTRLTEVANFVVILRGGEEDRSLTQAAVHDAGSAFDPGETETGLPEEFSLLCVVTYCKDSEPNVPNSCKFT